MAYEAGWVPKWVSTFGEEKNPVSLAGILTPDRPARILVTISTALQRLWCQVRKKKGKVIPLQARCGPEGG